MELVAREPIFEPQMHVVRRRHAPAQRINNSYERSQKPEVDQKVPERRAEALPLLLVLVVARLFVFEMLVVVVGIVAVPLLPV